MKFILQVFTLAGENEGFNWVLHNETKQKQLVFSNHFYYFCLKPKTIILFTFQCIAVHIELFRSVTFSKFILLILEEIMTFVASIYKYHNIILNEFELWDTSLCFFQYNMIIISAVQVVFLFFSWKVMEVIFRRENKYYIRQFETVCKHTKQ